MKLQDFCHALDEGNIARAAWGVSGLSCQGIIHAELTVDADEMEMVLTVAADNGFRWDCRWTLHFDSQMIDPLRLMPMDVQLLACQLGLGVSEFREAIEAHASEIALADDEPMDSSDDYRPERGEAACARRLSEAIRDVEKQVARWAEPLLRVRNAPDLSKVCPVPPLPGIRTVMLQIAGGVK